MLHTNELNSIFIVNFHLTIALLLLQIEFATTQPCMNYCVEVYMQNDPEINADKTKLGT